MHRALNALLPFAKKFTEAGFELYLVGGAVRNLVLNRDPVDFDFATDATPDEVKALFRRVIPTGEAHGTVTVLFKGKQYEVTTYRSESGYSDGRRPDTVTFAGSIDEDLSRRDFTINAMAVSLPAMELTDPHDGRGDIKRRLIRAIGEPRERFREDGLRLMRAVRFAAQLDFDIDPPTFEAMRKESGRLEAIASERIRDELQKLLLSDAPERGLTLMQESQLLAPVLPELAEAPGRSQGSDSSFDLFEHTLETVRFIPPTLELRLAALFHDLAKGWTLTESEDGRLAFPDHDTLSAEVAERRLTELRFPRRTVEEVAHLVRHHMFSYTSGQSDASIRRLISKHGVQRARDLITLRRADVAGKRGKVVPLPLMDELQDRISRVIAEEAALSRKDLAVDGRDLLDLGIPKGPALGVVLDELLETVLDDPEMNRREKLLTVAERIYRERMEA